MKWLGLVTDPKDLTTKEYVDSADSELRESTSKSIQSLEQNKVNSKDISEYSQSEVTLMWAKHFKL